MHNDYKCAQFHLKHLSYKVLNLHTHDIIFSRDVTFRESIFLFVTRKSGRFLPLLIAEFLLFPLLILHHLHHQIFTIYTHIVNPTHDHTMNFSPEFSAPLHFPPTDITYDHTSPDQTLSSKIIPTRHFSL